MEDKQVFLGKLEDLKYDMLDKQNRINDLLRELKECNNEESLWVKLDLLIEEHAKKKPTKFTADKFGVPLKTSETGTFTKEECIRRGFDPIKCQWLLKPELREVVKDESKRG